MARQTKTQKKNALKAIRSKSATLYLNGAMSLKDTSAIEAIVQRNLKKLG
jgi:hypothetical protein